MFLLQTEEKDTMDDIIKLCDELESCKRKNICYKNEIVCTRALVNRYIDGDDSKRSKLKAQIRQHGRGLEQGTLSTISQSVSVMSLLVTVVSGGLGVEQTMSMLFAFGTLVALLIISIIGWWSINKFGHRDKWKQYIQVVLEDMEK